ncbi:MAG: NHL repeat-containing protein [Candidatus Nanoarchaeia archaeon]|nr:NHL repeat-containing protein [Candidatus Nanoarchaeia archaeon]MDD5239291.1 NHL repeat-containing protein [Candidatus Nanoarchaeia archaeon]
MELKYIIATIFVIILVLGCSAKETQPNLEAAEEAQTTQPATETRVEITPSQPAATVAGSLVLIADTENQRVIEINKDTKAVTWQYGCTDIYVSGRCTYGASSNQLYLPTSAVYDDGNVLIADKGNDRVIELSKGKEIVWTYSKDLDTPTFAYPMSNGNVLITDSVNNRVIEVTTSGEVVWTYGCFRMSNTDKCVAGKEVNELNVPNSAVELENGNILIADKGNNRVIEVTKNWETVFEYKNGLVSPMFASKSGSGYLIVNTNNNKVVTVDAQGAETNTLSGFNRPAYAEEENSKFLVADTTNNRIVETDAAGNIVWYYGDCTENDAGVPNAPCKLGAEAGQLFKPSSAVLG